MNFILAAINLTKNDYFMLALLVFIGYAIGNINFALIISKLKKRDIRKEDSGNPGAMNMIRNYGTVLGAATLLLDALKGASAVLVGYLLLKNNASLSQAGKYVGGVSVILGHIYPIVLKFKGGKGIASSIGVCFALNPIWAAIAFVVGALFIIVTKMGAITSFIIISFPLAIECNDVAQKLFEPQKSIAIVCMLTIFLLTLFAHRKNIKKMFLGVERKTSVFSKYKK